MKFNFINKTLIAISFTLLIAIIYNVMSYKSWDRYYYFSSVCAPESYPIRLQDCYFITADKNEHGTIKDEDILRNNSKWGEEYFSPEVREPLRLPKQLVLEYVSYSERKKYQDTIDLPQEKIKNIFIKADKNNQFEDIHKSSKEVKGLRFLVGIASNGNVIVWIRGKFLEEVLLKTKLKPKDEISNKENKSIDIEKIFKDLPDDIKTKVKSGWEKNANYLDSITHYIELNKERWQ